MVFARRSRPAALAQAPAVRVAQLAAAISYSKKKRVNGSTLKYFIKFPKIEIKRKSGVFYAFKSSSSED